MTDSSSIITILGFGPGNPDSRTIGAQRALDTADRIILRTRIHPGIEDLSADPRVTDCDDLYESAGGFDELYPAIADRVLGAARHGGSVVFAVPGHPRFGERVVPLIEDRARDLGIPVTVLDAVSFVDAIVETLRIDPVTDGLQIVDAEYLSATLDRDPFAAGLLGVDPARPLIVAQLYNRKLAGAVKIALSRIYSDDHPVTLVRSAGVWSESDARCVPLQMLDRQAPDHLTSLWVLPQAVLDAIRAPESLLRIVATLRTPGGCPWDREQSTMSLRNSVLEEAYEVVEAIDLDDREGLAEELGDLLLLIAMLSQIAEEEGTFRIEDVFEGVNRKIIRRHPHVFGDVPADTPDAVVATWESVKAEERKVKRDARTDLHPIDRLPRAMPATRKVIETLAPRTLLRAPDDPAVGDGLLGAVRTLIDEGIDPERALELSLRKFATERLHGHRPPKSTNGVTEPESRRA